MLDAVLALNETDTQVFDFASQAAPPAGEPSGHITVPDAHLLFNGEFKRVGTSDLKIVGDDGASFFIRDYFGSDKAPHLISPEGATLSASIVAALAGPLAPGQSAQAGAQQAGQPVIGRVDILSGSCNVVRNGVSVALNVGDTVRKGDVVQTAGGSAVAIVFTDGSTFSLNANARMVLDDFVYNAGGTGNSALISLVQGTFSFVAGQVAKTGDMRVDTPVATMGIRGTAVLVEISANDGQTRFSVMTEPDGTTGSYNLYDKTSGALIGTVSNAQIGWLVTPAGPLQVVAQQLQKTPAQLQQELGIIQQIFTIFNNNQQNPFTPDPNDPGRRGDNPNDPNPQTAQGSGGGSGGLVDGDPSDGSTPGIVNHLPQPGTYDYKLPPLPGAPPPVVPVDVTVVVTANKPPVAINDANGSSGGGDVIQNDSDPEGSVIVVKTAQHLVRNEATGQDEPTGPVVTVGSAGATIQGTYGTLTLHPDGTYTFTPNEAFKALGEGDPAVDKFQYTISDPFGATATAVLSIGLTGVNDAPVATNDTAQNDPDGVPAGSVLTNDTDPDTGDTLSVVSARHLSDGPSNESVATVSAKVSSEAASSEVAIIDPESNDATAIEGDYGTLYLKADGSYTFEPNDAFKALGTDETVVDRFEYTITDGHVTSTAVLTITLTGTDSGPHATADLDSAAAAGFVDGEWTFGDPLASGNVLTNDADPDAGDSLKVIGVRAGDHSEGVTGKVNTIVQGTYGYLVLLQNGSYVYTLNNLDPDTIKLGEDQTGHEIFTYTVRDADGNTSTTTLTIDVAGANSAPSITSSARERVGTVTEDSTALRTDTGTLAVFDPDNNDIKSWSIHAHEGQTQDGATSVRGTYGTLTIDQGGKWIYTLDNSDPDTNALKAGQHPTETFSVVVTDSHGASDVETVRVTVNGTNDAPAALSDSAFVLSGESITIDVLANDTDAEHDALSLIGVHESTHGTVSIVDGQILYKPDEGFSGTDDFSYTIRDSHGASTTGHVSVVVGRADHVQVGGDVFLQGNYMEIGVSGSGSLGTANAAPTGYHPQGFPGISYVVDIDGWDAGNLPTAGDFTLPGTPEDSIVVGYNGSSFANDERLGYKQIVTTTTDTSSYGHLEATTIGLTETGLKFTQVIELDANATYYKTTITLQNTTEQDMDDVRFMRSFDPDQDISRINGYEGGSYHTLNDVLSNPSAGNDIAIAQAFGPLSKVSVNLVSFDERAHASNFGFTNHDIYTPAAYDSPQDRNGQYVDEAITLTFDAGTLAAGQQTLFEFYTSLNGDQGANDMLVGTSGADILNGRNGDDVIIGLNGDDNIWGGQGNDHFIFSVGMGQDTINDFVAGAGTDDIIELRGFAGESFEQLLASATHDPQGTTLHLSSGDSLKLVGVDIQNLHKDDFIFTT